MVERPGRWGSAATLGAVTSSRYRCTSCGNLTRFEVTVSRRERAYHHYTVGGKLDLEDVELLEETIESVQCRWCGPPGVIETVTADVTAD